MTYDEDLAARVRAVLAGAGVVEEKRMFGGLSFLVDGSLAVAASGEGGLLVPVGADFDALVRLDHVAPMRMGARSSDSWVQVQADAVRTEEQLEQWVARGVRAAASRGPRGSRRR